MQKSTLAIGALVALGLAAALAWFWSRPPVEPPPEAPAPVVAAPAADPASAPAASPPAVAASPSLPASDAAAPAPVPPPLPADDASVRQALVDLVGREAVLQLLQTDGFAERIVATVDNLPRTHVAPRLWPVHPTAGRFTVDAGGARIALDNAERYGPLVRMIEGVDPRTAAAFYRRLQPQLQAAYENLGYPGRSFHERLLEVIDHLLATPPAPSPTAVTLTEVKGPIAPERPWVRYEYADPALESRSAGQKVLLRVGEVHQRRLMAWLRGLRAELGR